MQIKNKKGGSGNNKINTADLLPVAHVVDGYKYGNDPRNNALGFQNNQDNMQNNLNKTHGGKKTRKNRKGGSGSPTLRPKTATVVQFPQVGPQVSPVTNANTASVNNNNTKVIGLNNATNDWYAYDTKIPTVGGSRKMRKNKKTRKVKKGGKNKKSIRKSRRTRRAGKNPANTKWGCYSGGFRHWRNSLRNIRSRLSNPINYPMYSSPLKGTKFSGTSGQL